MTLCDLCLSVSFLSLPSPPPGLNSSATVAGNEEFKEFDFSSGMREAGEIRSPCGFAFHRDLNGLGSSAKSCPLCKVVYAGVRAWIDMWKDAATNDKRFIEFGRDRQPIPTGQQLWLTACSNRQQGFYVWAQNPARESMFYLLTAVGFGVESTSPLADIISTRPLVRDSAAVSNLDLVATWLRRCAETHTNEECITFSTALPTRVLDVGVAGDIIRLVDGSLDKGKYVALSYCWGDSPPFITSHETMNARRSGFHINEAPQTFIDAVVITRHLRLRYLWIDALCICQNDAEDWARESSRMVDVYSNAYVVIAASRSDNCNKGCFHVRQDRLSVTIDLPGGLDKIHVTTLFQTDQDVSYTPGQGEFRGEPLSSRGWALQERVLARRIIHYNSRQLYFECNTGMLAEDGSYIPFHPSDPSKLRRPQSDPHDITEVPGAWYSLLRSFGNRKLTRPTDKLPAMSGLARSVQRRTKSEYVAGLWSSSMIEGMAWEASGRGAPVSRDEYTGPSWSWASYDGMVVCPAYTRLAIAEVLDWNVVLKHAENPFGEVTDAWVRIQGPVAPLRPSSPERCEHNVQLDRVLDTTPRLKVCTPYSEVVGGPSLKLDYNDAQDSGEWRGWDLQVLLLCDYEYSSSEAEKTTDIDSSNTTKITCGLAIRSERAGHMDRMRRVGTVFMNSQEGFKIKGSGRNWRTILLV